MGGGASGGKNETGQMSAAVSLTVTRVSGATEDGAGSAAIQLLNEQPAASKPLIEQRVITSSASAAATMTGAPITGQSPEASGVGVAVGVPVAVAVGVAVGRGVGVVVGSGVAVG